MQKRKYCAICGSLIVDLDNPETNFYRAIRVKYCDHCKQIAHNIQAAKSGRDKRAEARELRRMQDQATEQTRLENELLRSILEEQAHRIRQLESSLALMRTR